MTPQQYIEIQKEIDKCAKEERESNIVLIAIILIMGFAVALGIAAFFEAHSKFEIDLSQVTPPTAVTGSY
jgi:uncharacterized membrane protein